MTENNEFERHNLAIDRDMEVDCDIGQEIAVYIETWFDVDQKFGTNIADEDGTWLNMYGKYNPFVDTLRIECEISRDNGSEYFDYEPTASESRLIKDMIAEKIREEYRQTPQEFCDALNNTGESVTISLPLPQRNSWKSITGFRPTVRKTDTKRKAASVYRRLYIGAALNSKV